MAKSVNRQILLMSRPEGAPGLDNFELVEAPVALLLFRPVTGDAVGLQQLRGWFGRE